MKSRSPALWAGTAFALPVDYDTDRYDATAAYNSRLYQGVFQYTFSHFSDNNLFVSLPYPYANTNVAVPAASSLLDAAEQQRAICHAHAGYERHSGDAHQPERTCRRGKAG